MTNGNVFVNSWKLLPHPFCLPILFHFAAFRERKKWWDIILARNNLEKKLASQEVDYQFHCMK